MDFAPPPWSKPLDVDAAMRAVPPDATLKGMFLLGVLNEAKRRRVTLRLARERYLPFSDYPLVEHMDLLVQAQAAFFPLLSVRQGLRKIGRGAPESFLDTTLGKIVMAARGSLPEVLVAAEKAFALSTRHARLTTTIEGDTEVRARFEGVYHFLDSHQVGVLEGFLRLAGIRPRVLVRLGDPGCAEMLCRWALPARSTSAPP